MTIIADRHLSAAPPKGPISSRAGGQSFAARIEAGERARDIVQDRALGFSEAGLLGLYFALGLSSKVAGQSGRNSGTDFSPEAMVPTGAKAVDKAIVKADNETVSINQHPNSGQTNGKANTIEPKRALQHKASSSPLLEVNVVGTNETAKEFQSPVSKLFRKEMLQCRPGSTFGLKIIDTPDGISIMFEETAVSDNEIQEFTDVAQQIANDFGVTVRRLFVNGKNSI